MNPDIQNPTSAGPEANAITTDAAAQKKLNLQLTADFENFKRRTRQEAEVRAAAQKESFILELLPSIDNLERAMASGADPNSLQFHEGVELTLQQLRLLLRHHDIEAEESVGQPFDPHRHEAVSQRHDPAQADQTIIEVFQRGYRKGEKVFRPAKVVVNDLTKTKQDRHAR
jgi:molecular chaperone GrpE